MRGRRSQAHHINGREPFQGEELQSIIPESRLKSKPRFLSRDHVVLQDSFQGEKRFAPNHFLASPKLRKYIKRCLSLFYYFSNTGTLKDWRDHSIPTEAL
jgi:hypothetical protein